jgi:metallo-beta-lactamase class B
MSPATFILLLALVFTACTQQPNKTAQTKQNSTAVEKQGNAVVYKTGNLLIEKLTEHTYVHTSYLQTETFGKVACNGLLVVNEGEALLFDTPVNDESSRELIQFVTQTLRCSVKGIVPTHFHNDCVGGLAEFEKSAVPMYANKRTLELLEQEGQPLASTPVSFTDHLRLTVGQQEVQLAFLGEGHTKDNIVVYFPLDQVLFGGCLIKEVGAGKGFLGDANLNAWSTTVAKVKATYPKAQLVVPGHGKWGDTALLDYTIELFKSK